MANETQLAARPKPDEHTQSTEIPAALTRRVVVERIEPQIDGGRFPIKRTVGETVDVSATIFADGHDALTAVLRDRHRQPRLVPGPVPNPESQITTPERNPSPESRIPTEWRDTPMSMIAPGTDRWTAQFDVVENGWHEYQIVAWPDRFLTWRRDLRVKWSAGQDVSVELLEGSLLIRDAANRAVAGDAGWLLSRAEQLIGSTPQADRLAAALGGDLAAIVTRYTDRSRATESAVFRVWVDRMRARFGAWYEMFPRSAGPDPTRSGTFREACAEIPRVADMGFDVLYLPPIHPIGTSFRKGRNNALVAAPEDPGSPWAIGSRAGGHTAIDPGLGTLDDFDAFRREAERLGLEIALDLAWQCSPDHPWVLAHPEWFRHRPDGSIKYAENPPKKYQDIYPFDFECADWQALWHALLEVTRFWIDRGVKIFRVDNPHTKTFGFWEWLIAEVHAEHPEVLFLSEAFTRPAPMRYLAKAGFTQSYTYFTWRNTKAELTEYFTELTASEVREYLRPNLFANTPDILHAYLQHGGRPAFQARLLLAATLGASYGIYSGFELAEGQAVPGTEEYADSEKYQFRKWDWNRPGHLEELIARVNQIRREHPALHSDRTLRFHATDNPELIAYSKATADGSDTILVVVNLDPLHMQHGHVEVPLDSLRVPGAGPAGAPHDVTYTVRDLIDDVTYEWRGAWNYVRFDPEMRQGHILWLPTTLRL
ncbi:MAG TPA: alpha-1,4-glucan--maltose-1-phosphate maltosyltransferase [Vicinamibacterales bacterium]|nr:alpha-1,4-glucan--maltose-1-phosphate maltosyltransferase [Vicinamibacterales bacterium]